MAQQDRQRRFEEIVLPHLDAAYNLARWITRNDADAADVVQEAFMRALTYFDGFRGTNSRAWLLTIVRNTVYRWLERNRPAVVVPIFGEVEAEIEATDSDGASVPDPETLLAQRRDTALLDDLIAELPPPYREAMVLRELEELSYKEIGDVLDVPIGTVMSRLARARGLLKAAWRRRTLERAGDGV